MKKLITGVALVPAERVEGPLRSARAADLKAQ